MIRKMGTIDLFGAASQFIFILKRSVLQKLSFHIDRNAKMGEDGDKQQSTLLRWMGKIDMRGRILQSILDNATSNKEFGVKGRSI